MDYEKKKEIVSRIVQLIDDNNLLCDFETVVKDDCGMIHCSHCREHVESAMQELIRSDAEKFVEEHGGLEAVKSKFASDKAFGLFTGALRTRDELEKEIQKLKDEKAEVIHTNVEFFEKLIKAVGIDEIPIRTAKERLFEELDKRLMPKGMEWPKFEDGEKVDTRSCNETYVTRNGETHTLCGVQFLGKDIFICDGKLDNNVCLSHKGIVDRVKREPEKVLDSDGVEIKKGDTVYCIATDEQLRDMGLLYENELKGKLIVKGFYSVYGKDKGYVCFYGTPYDLEPKHLTHKEPDSWDKLEKDACKSQCSYFGFDCKPCKGCPADGRGISCREAVGRDIIKRAKALSEKCQE